MSKILELVDVYRTAADAHAMAHDALCEVVEPIVKAMGRPMHRDESVIGVRLEFNTGLRLETDYWTDDGRETDSYLIPLSILDAPDPILAAAEFRVEKARRAEEKRLERARADVARLESQVTEAKRKLDEAKKKAGLE